MVVRALLRNPKIQERLTEEVDNRLREPGEDNDIMPGLVPIKNFNLPFTDIEIPIGDKGLYVTPSEPADPTDCSRYPDSPFCGGIPLTTTPIGLDPEIINDGCNIGVRLNPAIAFIRLPPVALVYRKPECRLKPKPLTPSKISPVTICYPIDCYHGDVTIGYSSTINEQNLNIIENYDSAIPSDLPYTYDRFGNTQLWFVTGHFTIKDYQGIQTCLTLRPEAFWVTSAINPSDPETYYRGFTYEGNKYTSDTGYITKPLI